MKIVAVDEVIVSVTFVTLVLGELVPKRIALHDPERMAARVSGLMTGLSRLAEPLVQLQVRKKSEEPTVTGGA